MAPFLQMKVSVVNSAVAVSIETMQQTLSIAIMQVPMSNAIMQSLRCYFNYAFRSFCIIYAGESFCSKYVIDNFYWNYGPGSLSCNHTGSIFYSVLCTWLFLL